MTKLQPNLQNDQKIWKPPKLLKRKKPLKCLKRTKINPKAKKKKKKKTSNMTTISLIDSFIFIFNSFLILQSYFDYDY